MTANMISVIMPVYNNRLYVDRAIRSVIAQTYTNWELIIINDKSTDNLNSILNKYKNNPKITIIDNTNNRGCYVSLNKGLQICKGQYIGRVDSDDRIHKDKLQSQINCFNKYPNLDIVFCKIKTTSGIVTSNCMGAALIKKKVFDRIGYYDSVRIAADAEFRARYFKVAGKNNVKYLDNILYFVNERNDSLSRSGKTGLNSLVRKQYKINYRKWHNTGEKLYMEFPLQTRKIQANKLIL